MSLLEAGLRRLFVGSKRKLVEAAIEHHIESLDPPPEVHLLNDLDERAREDGARVLVGTLAEAEDIPVAVPVSEFYGVHRWIVGATGRGKSAQAFAEEMQLIGPGMPWSLLHVDAKGESAEWITDLLLPAMLRDADEDDVIEVIRGLNVVAPFDESNLPEMNLLAPVGGISRSLHAKEIANLIGEALGGAGGDWGVRMMGILLNGLRLMLSVGGLSILELRSALINDRYLNGLLREVEDYEIREYFTYRFPQEPTESVQAVVARLDLLLFEDTARVLCAPGCVSYASLLEGPLTVVNLGGAPRGAEFLTRFWISVFVRGLARAIYSRRDTRRPVIAAIDEWWLGLDADLAGDFESLLTLARHKNVALWLINQLPAQVASRSSALLATIENSCGYQTVFQQSPSDARRFSHMFPVSEHCRVRRDLDGPRYETRVERPSEQRARHVEELIRLPKRHFWFYPRALGRPAAWLIAPEVPFDDLRRAADQASDDLRALCRGYGCGTPARVLDEAIEKRKHHIKEVTGGFARDPRRDLRDRVPHEVRGSVSKPDRREPQLPPPGKVRPRPAKESLRGQDEVEAAPRPDEQQPRRAPGGQTAPPPVPSGDGQRATGKEEKGHEGQSPKGNRTRRGPFIG